MSNLLYVVLFIIGLMVFMQVYIRLATHLKKGKKIEGLEKYIGRKDSAGQKHLFYFYTNSCAACKPMGPIIDKLKNQFKNVHKINLATEMEVGRKFGVMGTPSVVILEDQKIKSFFVGAKSESFLQKQMA